MWTLLVPIGTVLMTIVIVLGLFTVGAMTYLPSDVLLRGYIRLSYR